MSKRLRTRSAVRISTNGDLAGIEQLEPRRMLTLATALDTIIFGNTASESARGLVATRSQTITGALGQPARQLLPLTTPDVNGGSLTFNMAVDPAQRNYFTVKLWGSDDTDQGKGRLYLYAPVNGVDLQVGYRHEGDYLPLSVTASDPPLPGRFFYSTTLLPLEMTLGRSTLTLKIQSTGELYGLGSGGPPSGTYQRLMDTTSRGIYRGYTHTQPLLNVSAETQGNAPATTTRPSVSESSVIGPNGTFTNGLKNWVTGRLNQASNTFFATQVEMLATAYTIPEITTGFANAAVITKVIDVIDGFARDYYINPTTSVNTNNYGGNGGNEVWGGRFGAIGWAVSLLSSVASFQSALNVSVDYGTAGGTRTRRAAWGDMLAASRDWGRFNRDARTITNQSLIADESIYKANRGLLALGDARAFSENAAQRYLKESAGLLPWLGSDLPGGGSTLKLGSNYFQVTPDGLTREWGYAGSYSDIAGYAARFYRWTGDTAFRDQATRMVQALGYMRRPAIAVIGNVNYRSVERIGLLAWRAVREADGYFANEISYAGPETFAEGMSVAAATLDPVSIGYAKQMLADNHYLQTLTADSRYFSNLTFDSRFVMEAFADYATVKAAPDSGVRIPTTLSSDFAWADETNGVVVIQRGSEKLWASPFWQAKKGTGINGVGRFHFSTARYDQYGTFESIPQYRSLGGYFVRPNFIDITEGTGYVPPVAPGQAYAGEVLPIAVAPPDADDDTPWRGRADFYQFRLGHYLIGLNASEDRNFELRTPNGFSSAVDVFSNTTRTGSVSVPARSTVALVLPSGSDTAPVPGSPLLLRAVGSSSQIALDWTRTTGASTYTIRRATSPNGPSTVIASGIASNTFIDSNVNAGQSYFYTVSAVNNQGEGYPSSPASASAGLKSGWTNADLGTVALPGSASLIDGTWTLRGSGSDVGGQADSGHFVYRSLTGDGSIIARVANASFTDGSDKIGLMFRQTLATDARSVSLQLRDASDSAVMAVRSSIGGNTSSAGTLTPVGAPLWLRIDRSGNLFTSRVSSDGITWTTVASSTVSMGSTVLIGMFVCSRYSPQVNASSFDQVTVIAQPISLSVTTESSGNITPGTTRQFIAQVLDAQNLPLDVQPSVAWSTTRGVIDSTGTLTAPASSGPLTVTATAVIGATNFSGSFNTAVALVASTPVYRFDTLVQRIEIPFNGAVNASFASSDLTLIHAPTATPVPAESMTISFNNTPNGVDAIISFPVDLANGDYILTVPSGSGVTDLNGTPLSSPVNFSFFQLAGDVNRDRSVNFADLVIMARNYGQTGRRFDEGNVTRDTAGLVDFADLVVLARGYGLILPAPRLAPFSTISLGRSRSALGRDDEDSTTVLS